MTGLFSFPIVLPGWTGDTLATTLELQNQRQVTPSNKFKE
jgi:hypothetical protein